METVKSSNASKSVDLRSSASLWTEGLDIVRLSKTQAFSKLLYQAPLRTLVAVGCIIVIGYVARQMPNATAWLTVFGLVMIACVLAAVLMFVAASANVCRRKDLTCDQSESSKPNV